MKKTYLYSALFSALFVFLFSSQAFSQRNTNVEALLTISNEKAIEWQEKKAEAVIFANQNNIPVKFQTSDGVSFELQSIKDGVPMYYITENSNSAATISTSNVFPGGSAGLNLDGTGMIVHEWDEGSVLSTHQEYSGRITNGNAASTSAHSTHVAGTMVASGVEAGAKGMAPNANLKAFDWNSDESEMASEAANGALFSNHSYGYGRGWVWTGSNWSWYGNTGISTDEDYLFGFYDSQAQDWDQIAYDAPYYLIVKSAGNDRGDGPTNGAYPLDGPYDCISHSGISKNVLTVGAVNDISGGYSGPSSVIMSSFSSWGPADDGRVKPDISTNGVSLYSSLNSNNSSYGSYSGTSMAAPSATGSLVLLQQHYENLNGTGNYMLAATLKALVLGTADEAGPNDGPDYMFGWGLMNTEKAAAKITENQTLNVIDELVLNNGETYTRTVHSDGLEPIKVTINWTELPGNPVAASLDPISSMLINDLDLRISFGGNTYYSWKLDRNNPSNAATNNSENNVDNVEVVYIAAPVAGDYTITVDHDGTLSGGSQAFSIIYDGISDNVVPVLPVADFSADNISIYIGETVNFTDLSTGIPTSWSWNFAGGIPATSVDQNPSVVYNTAGTYDVTLTATNAVGSDAITKIAYITVSVHAPVADFSSNITTVLFNETVSFTDESTYSPTSWSWTFAGGTPAVSADQNPVITYTTVGTYDVSLTVTNAGGNDTKTIVGYITVTDGSVTYCDSYSLNFSTEYISNVTVGNLNNSSLGSAYSDFTNQIFNAEPGVTYDINLTPWKSSANRKESWRVWIDYNADGDFYDAGELVFSTDRKRNPVIGTFTIPSGASGNTVMRIAMAYNTTSIDPCGVISYGEVEDYSVSMTAPVPQPPVADFVAGSTAVVEGQSVQFTDLSANDPTSWSWSFIGGTPATSTSQNPLITYSTEGTYSVTLTATNALGSDVHTKTGYIVVSVAGSITYCTSQSSSNALEWISQVDIGSFTNASGASFYSDYTGMTINLSPGSSNAVTFTPTFTGKDQREFWRVWIDFNADGDFDDADETVFVANNKKSATSGTISIPSYAFGQTRMRVTMKNGGSPTPCESFGGGEVEDYTVSFAAGTVTAFGDGFTEEFSFNMYPNPVNNVLNINVSGAEDLIEISVFNSSGMLINTAKVENGNYEMNMDNYSGGIYFLKVNSGDNLIMKRFVKM